MTISIQTQGFELTDSLKHYVTSRINLGMSNRFESIGNIGVGLSDINGPRGGADKCCRIHIALPQQPDVVIKDIQPDMYDAINSALRRARRVLARRMAKHRAKRRDHRAETLHEDALVSDVA